MELHIVARGFACTDSIRTYVEKRMAPHVKKYLHDRDAVVVYVRLEDVNGPKGGSDKQVSVDIRFPKRHHVHVADTGEDLFSTIDIVAKELENVLQRDKKKYMIGTRYPKKQYLAKAANTPE